MFTESEIKESLELLNLLKSKGFPFHFNSNHEFDDWCNENENWCDEECIGIHRGATKMVFEFEDLDFVLKIGFESTSKQNYEDLEFEKYQLAKTHGFAEYLAKIDYVCKFDGLNVYGQEKCTCDMEYTDSVIHKYSLDTIRQDDGESKEAYLDRVYDYEDDYCEEDYFDCFFSAGRDWHDIREFLDFCDENDINDLHKGNFGVNEKGQWVIVDYSGFFGFDSWSRDTFMGKTA